MEKGADVHNKPKVPSTSYEFSFPLTVLKLNYLSLLMLSRHSTSPGLTRKRTNSQTTYKLPTLHPD